MTDIKSISLPSPTEVTTSRPLEITNVTTNDGPPAGFGKGVNDYLNYYVTVADAKSIALMGVNITLSGLLVSNRPTALLPLALIWAAAICFVISALISAYELYPRLPTEGKGTIFWEDILTRATASAYQTDIRQLNEHQVEYEYALQNYFVSKVLRKKYQSIRRCIILFVIGIAIALFGIALT